MSFRSFEIIVGKKGVTPSVINNAGVQSEHNATELVFKLDSDAQDALETEKNNGKTLYYRFDGYDGAGNKSSTEPKEVKNLSISFRFLLENWITQSGININVCLVFTAARDNETETEVFSGAVKLQLRNLPAGKEISGENVESMTTLCTTARGYAERAETAKRLAAASEEACAEAAEKTAEARLALEEGAVWIFDGGTAEVTVEETITIDSVMSDESENPVKNKVIKKYVDENISNTFDRVLNVEEQLKALYDEPVSIHEGGTGATTPEGARSNLGIPKIQCGIANCLVSGDSDNPATTTIYFDEMFSNAPSVNLTVNSGMARDGSKIHIGVVGVGVTQFTVSAVGATDGTIGVYWIAVGT